MKKVNNRKNNRKFTPRQRQIIYRKAMLFLSSIFVAIVLSVILGGMFNESNAADNYHKYYTSIAIMPGDTITEYYETYGEHYKSSSDYIKEVCMINSVDPDNLKAGNYIIVPYYSQEVK